MLIAMYGQGKTRGQVAKLGIPATTNQACAAILFKGGYSVDYYFQFLQAQYKNIRSMSNGGGQNNLSTTLIKTIRVPVPPHSEQIKIAQILSTWDKAIETTEQLLNNSQQQKKALMQQLLTGKRRFGGFINEWKVIELGKLVRYTKGFTYKSVDYSELPTSYGFFTLKSIEKGGGFNEDGLKYLANSVDSKFEVLPGDIIFAITDITRMAEVVGAPVLVPQLELPFMAISMDMVKLNLNSTICNKFLFYYLKLRDSRCFMRARASGSTVLHLDVKASKKLNIKLPTEKHEQEKIALAISNADHEIEILKKHLVHLKQEKKALMQQLLTGKRRVKTDTKEVAYG